MARTGPKLSPNPGRTARFYRKNKKSREKHRRDNAAINSTPAKNCLLYTSPSPRDGLLSRMPSSA